MRNGTGFAPDRPLTPLEDAILGFVDELRKRAKDGDGLVSGPAVVQRLLRALHEADQAGRPPDGCEAEELRSAIEEYIEALPARAARDVMSGNLSTCGDVQSDLQAILDRIDARDSLAYLESRDAKGSKPIRKATAEEAAVQRDEAFVEAVHAMSGYIHDWAVRKGFWPGEQNTEGEAVRRVINQLGDAMDAVASRQIDAETFSARARTAIGELPVRTGPPPADRNDAEMIALMHSELSEALEGLRDGNPTSEKLGEPFTQVEEELADLVIRCLDMADGRNYALGRAIVAKMAYNEGRPYKHNREF